MNFPYVYKLTHKENSQFYIGYREANLSPANLDIGFHYFTSSKTIQNIGFDNFYIDIINEFDHIDRETAALAAYDLENKLISENFDDPLCLNGHYRSRNVKGFRNNKGTTGYKMTESNKILLSQRMKGRILNEAQRKSLSRSGSILSQETKDKIRLANIGRKMKPEDIQKSVDANRGKKRSQETKDKMREASKNRKPISEDTRLKMSIAAKARRN